MRTRLQKNSTVSGISMSEAPTRRKALSLWSWMVLLIAMLCANQGFSQILNTGLASPSSNAGVNSVSNPANAYSSNNQDAVFNSSGDAVRYGGFGFSLPSGVTILGIEVRLEGARSSSRDLNVSLSWNDGSSFTSNQLMPSFGSSDGTSVVGGPFDTWGRTWSAAELADAEFGVRCVATSGSGDINLDHVQVRVYYANYISTYTSSGSFVVPAGVTSVYVDAWGAGGGGSNASSAGGGGGGGAYTRGTISGLTGGNSVAVTVGSGGNAGSAGGFSRAQFGASNVTANGGSSTNGRTGGSGGSASTVTGNILASFAGGDGGNARSSSSGSSNEAGGGGGGSAYSNAAGGDGSNGGSSTSSNTAGGTGQGDGGLGAAADNSPSATSGSIPGGGGGGRGESSGSSASGANGMVIITWCPTYSITSTAAASPVCVTNPTSLITLTGTATGLPVGTYTVTYNRSNPAATGLTATLTVSSAGTGTFTATGLTAAGSSTITVTKIASSTTDCDSTISNGNTAVVSVVGAPTANAGSNATVCYTTGAVAITAGSSASNADTTTWTSNGTGTFANANSLTTATYTPSAGDLAAGSVVLTLTSTPLSGCSGNATSQKTLTFALPPTASAGGSATICQNQTHQVSGASSSNGTIVWTENGAGSITAGQGTLTPTYTAAAGDAGNTVILTMTVSNAPCSAAQAFYTINVLALPTANAGTAVSTCANSGAVNITAGATAGNNSGVLWTSSGTGIFTDADSLTSAMYTPSEQDIANGSVTLTLTAFGNGSCNNATANKVLTILPIPEATGVVICQGTASHAMSATGCASNPPVTTPSEFASAGATSGSGTAWSSPGNAVTNNNSNASFSASAGLSTVNATSQTLAVSNFGFAIPANAIINGIEVEIGRFRSGTALAGEVQDNSVRLRKAGSDVGNNLAQGSDWPGSESAATYGGSSNLWGTSWSPADINSSTFGVSLVADISVFLGTRTANVDYMSVKVTYTVPGEMQWYTQSSGGTLLGTGSSFNPVGVAGSGLADTNTPGVTTYYVECSTVAGCRTPVDYVINPLPVVTIPNGLDAFYCEDAAAVTISGNYAGGTFSGAGITDNGDGTASFDPATAGVGQHTITYTYTDGNTCVNSATTSTEVYQNVTYYRDADGDGFGNIAVTTISCTGAPVGYVSNSTDCNDSDATKNAEFQFYVDADGDSFGAGSLVSVCAVDANTPPANYSLNDTDCDDNDNTKNGMYPFFVDNDGDTYGAGSPVMVCAVDALTPPSALYVLNNTDCDDNDSAKHAMFDFYADNDNDGYGAGSAVSMCAVDAMTPPVAGYSALSTDCDDNDNTVHPNALEIGYNLIDDDCDGLIDEGFPPKVTQMQSAFCNVTLPAMDSQIVANLVAGAQGYRWRVTTMSGPNATQVQVLDTPLRTMKMTQLANYAFDTEYKIEVAVYYAGFLQPFTTSNCTVTTPSPVTKLTSCDATMNLITDAIHANLTPFATGYRFRISDPLNPLNAQEIDRPIRDFKLSMVNNFVIQYGKTYNVEVAVRNTDGSYLPYGPMCTISTPVFPTTSLKDEQCDDYLVEAYNTMLYATSYPGAIAYVFEISGPGLVSPLFVTHTTRAFSLSDFTGLIPGATYNVRVRLVFHQSDPAGPYGKVCTIVVPGLSRHVKQETAFSAVAYPNPFAETFNVDVTTASDSDINVKVYDMTGRLLENANAKSGVQSVTLGESYPSGVYNVVVSQGDDVRTLRVIKR